MSLAAYATRATPSTGSHGALVSVLRTPRSGTRKPWSEGCLRCPSVYQNRAPTVVPGRFAAVSRSPPRRTRTDASRRPAPQHAARTLHDRRLEVPQLGRPDRVRRPSTVTRRRAPTPSRACAATSAPDDLAPAPRERRRARRGAGRPSSRPDRGQRVAERHRLVGRGRRHGLTSASIDPAGVITQHAGRARSPAGPRPRS